MDTKNDGGAAFPNVAFKADGKGLVYGIGHPGMSLRDHFAAQALTGFIVASRDAVLPPGIQATAACAGLAVMAYAAADAMIKARGE